MEFAMTARGERQLLNNQYLYNKKKTGDGGNTYWECMERMNGNRCAVRTNLDQHEVFLESKCSAQPSSQAITKSCEKDKDQC